MKNRITYASLSGHYPETATDVVVVAEEAVAADTGVVDLCPDQMPADHQQVRLVGGRDEFLK